MYLATALLLGAAIADDSFLNDDSPYKVACYGYGDFSFFDLRSMENKKQDYMYLSKGVIMPQNTTFEDTWQFNLCKPVTRSSICANKDTKVWALRQHNDSVSGVSCLDHSGSDLLKSYSSNVLRDNVTNLYTYQIQYNGGDVCP